MRSSIICKKKFIAVMVSGLLLRNSGGDHVLPQVDMVVLVLAMEPVITTMGVNHEEVAGG